ncbi:VapE domain-containing protein [uncultured Bacteroides sp.]|uniref:VapE domain-containing protein n=1 Tax=uncultured Bacteroides sp. TaxID=162156 RepID=UPI002AA8A26A|nr:VapE domain-containing protein [uncultured Bacteroides sp.]
MKNIVISLFKNAASKQPATVTLKAVIEGIHSGRWKEEIIHIQQLTEEEKKKEAAGWKRKLPYVTFGGVFEGGHQAAQLRKYSSLVVLDYDGVPEADELERMRKRSMEQRCVVSVFITPSGRGLKVVVLTAAASGQHARTFAAVTAYFDALLQHRSDTSCKDISRGHFVSWDERAVYNGQAEPFEQMVKETETNKEPEGVKENASRPQKAISNEERTKTVLAAAMMQLNKKMLYTKGNRNNYLFELLCHLNRKGIESGEAERLCRANFELPAEELSAIVRSAYSHEKEHACKAEKEKTEKKQELIKNIEQHLARRYELRFNTVLNRLEFRRKGNKKSLREPMTDYDENSIYRGLLLEGFDLRISLLHSILNSNFVPLYDPFTEYFKALAPWDGQTDYIAQLAETVTTTNPAHWKLCLRKWLVAMVAGWLRPEVVNHTVLVLIGKQGIYKTSWGLRLMPPELEKYRYSGTINTHDKDGLFTLSQCGLINNEEIENMTQRELNEFKALVTQGVINQRAAYGHNKEYLIRRASFIANGNNKEILTDPTGNRRFLCFEVTDIRPSEDFLLPYAGIYAQAFALLQSGFCYWFDRKETKLVNSSNKEFELRSVEEEQLSVCFRKPARGEQGELMTASQIMGKLMVWVRTPMSVVRVGRALKKWGYERITMRGVSVYLVMELTVDEVNTQKRSIKREGDVGDVGVLF